MTASSAMPSKQVLMIVNLAWPYLLNPISHVGRRSNFTSIACICRSTILPSTELCTDLLPTSLFLVSLRTSTKDCKTMCLGLPLMTSFKLWGSLHRRKFPIETDIVSKFKVPASGTHLFDTLSGPPVFRQSPRRSTRTFNTRLLFVEGSRFCPIGLVSLCLPSTII